MTASLTDVMCSVYRQVKVMGMNVLFVIFSLLMQGHNYWFVLYSFGADDDGETRCRVIETLSIIVVYDLANSYKKPAIYNEILTT